MVMLMETTAGIENSPAAPAAAASVGAEPRAPAACPPSAYLPLPSAPLPLSPGPILTMDQTRAAAREHTARSRTKGLQEGVTGWG